jgi:hypothetical protein
MSNHQPWVLLRIWHLEAMETAVAEQMPSHFTRTSYLSAPTRWRELPVRDLAARIEQVLAASYKRRAWQLRTPEDPWSLVPFAFYFEWVGDTDTPANPSATSDPFIYPCANANPVLAQIAARDLDQLVQAARTGISSRCYEDRFSTFRIDEDDTWHLVPARESAALFQARYNTDSPNG